MKKVYPIVPQAKQLVSCILGHFVCKIPLCNTVMNIHAMFDQLSKYECIFLLKKTTIMIDR